MTKMELILSVIISSTILFILIFDPKVSERVKSKFTFVSRFGERVKSKFTFVSRFGERVKSKFTNYERKGGTEEEYKEYTGIKSNISLKEYSVEEEREPDKTVLKRNGTKIPNSIVEKLKANFIEQWGNKANRNKNILIIGLVILFMGIIKSYSPDFVGYGSSSVDDKELFSKFIWEIYYVVDHPFSGPTAKNGRVSIRYNFDLRTYTYTERDGQLPYSISGKFTEKWYTSQGDMAFKYGGPPNVNGGAVIENLPGLFNKFKKTNSIFPLMMKMKYPSQNLQDPRNGRMINSKSYENEVTFTAANTMSRGSSTLGPLTSR